MGGLMKCSQPSGCCAFIFAVRLASHPFMHPLLQAVGGGNSEAVCFVGCLVKILTTIRLLRYLTSSSALHPILLCIPFSKLLGGIIWAVCFVGRLASHPFMHPRLQAVRRRNLGRSASRDPIPLDLRFAWICVGVIV